LVLLVLAAAAQGYSQGTVETATGERFAVGKSIHVFPNPASDYVHIRMDEMPVANLKLTFHNIIGNEIAAEVETVNEHELRIKVKDFSAGYYLLAVRDEYLKYKGTFKFLKR
jgi:hypothetical protein